MPAPRIVFAGSVNTSRTTLERIVASACNLAGVLELDPAAAKSVSGFARLDDLAAAAGVPCVGFRKINDSAVVQAVRTWQPDLLFVVGLSQLVGDELLALPRRGCVGFHPTHLPAGRGRAPIAWLALGQAQGAATFFLMDSGADSGPILVQESFDVAHGDYAFDIEQSIHAAIRRGLDRWLPKLNAGHWNPLPQNHDQATYLEKRTPADGLIDWHASAGDILCLVRAASRPFPGAYTYATGTKLIIWQASVVDDLPVLGVTGRIVCVDDQQRPIVQTGDGLLRLDDFALTGDGNPDATLRVGVKLGYAVEDELHRLRRRVAELESQLERVLNIVDSTVPAE